MVSREEFIKLATGVSLIKTFIKISQDPDTVSVTLSIKIYIEIEPYIRNIGVKSIDSRSIYNDYKYKPTFFIFVRIYVHERKVSDEKFFTFYEEYNEYVFIRDYFSVVIVTNSILQYETTFSIIEYN